MDLIRKINRCSVVYCEWWQFGAVNEGLTQAGLSGIKVTWRLLSVFILILTDIVVVLIVWAILLWWDYALYLTLHPPPPQPHLAPPLVSSCKHCLFSCWVLLLIMKVCYSRWRQWRCSIRTAWSSLTLSLNLKMAITAEWPRCRQKNKCVGI